MLRKLPGPLAGGFREGWTMMKTRGLVGVLVAAMLSLVASSACAPTPEPMFLPPYFSSYREIPGVTSEEIAAIEALAAANPYLSYGMLPSTELFINADGELGGFAVLVCEWLSGLFGIPFEPQMLGMGDIFEVVQSGQVDFTGDLRITQERRDTYLATDPIALRSLIMIRHEDSLPISSIAQTRPLRYMFLRDSVAISDVAAVSEPGFHETIEIDMVTGTAHSMLAGGEADALIVVSNAEAYFAQYPDLVVESFLPLTYSPVSLVTAKSELWPIISVTQKALEAGGVHHLGELYKRGYQDYAISRLFASFDEEEIAYIKSDPDIALAAEYDNYPISFYDMRHGEWQGISHDILAEVEAYTGLRFTVVNEQDTDWAKLLDMLLSGEADVISDLIYTPERQDDFLWTKESYMMDSCVLITETDFPDISIHDVLVLTVGVTKGTAHESLMRQWFPDHRGIIAFDNNDALLDALTKGEIDAAMDKSSLLLQLTHYHELPGYKVAFVFSNDIVSSIGLNKDQELLARIIDKTLLVVDTEAIESGWLRRTYDYRAQVLQARLPWVVGTVVALVLALLILALAYKRTREKHAETNRMIESERRAELAEASSLAKSRFLATMSHEIRTPMNSIMGFAELAMDSDKQAQIKEYLAKITDGTKWLLNIIDDILDISKIEAGKIELEYIPFKLSDIFARCQSVILPSIKEKGLDFKVYAESVPGRMFLGDQVRLYQTLINLLSNAVKFTELGSIRFLATATAISDDHATVYFEIKDTGIGMTKEQIDRIYEPFTQADSSTTREYGGTGLGLSIAKNIVELMGGKLSVESVHGSGSTFSFELCFKTLEAGDDQAGHMDMLPRQKPLFSALILVCDDNPMNREVICEHLARVGIRTETAENGEEAIAMVARHEAESEEAYDLIFMDIFMPIMDGMDAAAKISQMDTQTPIVAMTANIMTGELENYRKAGMPDCLGKPFTSHELWRILLKYLVPVSSAQTDEGEDDSELQKKLRNDFMKNNRDAHEEIAQAAAAGDTKRAHRLAHSLKGNAGLIGKSELKAAAEDVEFLLREGPDSVWDNKMKRLKSELESVFAELEGEAEAGEEELPKDGGGGKLLTGEEALALLDELTPMLDALNPQCLDLLPILQGIPGAGELMSQIENFDFSAARLLLPKLRAALEREPREP